MTLPRRAISSRRVSHRPGVRSSPPRRVWAQSRLVQRQKPDLVLLDVVMLGVDGLEVCRRLKYDVATRDVTVIMVRGSAPRDVRRAREVGAKVYIWKPFNEDESAIRRICGFGRRAAPSTEKGEGA